jgi:hypothetical protein
MLDGFKDIINSLPEELREMAIKVAEQAQKFGDLLVANKGAATNAVAVSPDGSSEMVIVVTTPEPLTEAVRTDIQAASPIPLRFLVGLKPETEAIFAEMDSQGLQTLLAVHKDCARDFQVAVAMPEQAKELDTEEFRAKLVKAVNSIMTKDGYPVRWMITLDGETIYETKPAGVSDADVEAIQKIESVDDIINS